jgi:GTPase SAR1 family protein
VVCAQVVLLGDASSGKTSLVLRYVEGRFRGLVRASSTHGSSNASASVNQSPASDAGNVAALSASKTQPSQYNFDSPSFCYQPTAGAFFLTKRVTVESNLTCKMMIWDTAGARQYAKLSPTYYKQAAACILCFDVSNPTSLIRVRQIAYELRGMSPAINNNALSTADHRDDVYDTSRRRQLHRHSFHGNDGYNNNHATTSLGAIDDAGVSLPAEVSRDMVLTICACKVDQKQHHGGRPTSPVVVEALPGLCEEAQLLAQQVGALYVECSARDDFQVDKVFSQTATQVLATVRHAILTTGKPPLLPVTVHGTTSSAATSTNHGPYHYNAAPASPKFSRSVLPSSLLGAPSLAAPPLATTIQQQYEPLGDSSIANPACDGRKTPPPYSDNDVRMSTPRTPPTMTASDLQTTAGSPSRAYNGSETLQRARRRRDEEEKKMVDTFRTTLKHQQPKEEMDFPTDPADFETDTLVIKRTRDSANSGLEESGPFTLSSCGSLTEQLFVACGGGCADLAAIPPSACADSCQPPDDDENDDDDVRETSKFGTIPPSCQPIQVSSGRSPNNRSSSCCVM